MRRGRPGHGDDRRAVALTRVRVDEATVAEARAHNADIERQLAETPSVHLVPVAVTRRLRRDRGGIWGPPVFLDRAEEIAIRTRNGSVRGRVLRPDGELVGVYLHFHGGGWALGACDEQDPRLAALADATGLCAVSVEYRLAPEQPFPAAPDDCEDAAVWLLERGVDELGAPRTLAVGGESAGAYLAVMTLLRLRDRHGIRRAFRAANLVYGAYDLSLSPSTRSWGERNLVLSRPIMEWFRSMFIPGKTLEERRDAHISPLYADLSDLPPALFSVGELDPLLDDSLFMSARWQAAGNEAELRVWPEAIHGFTAFPIELARRALGVQHEFLRAKSVRSPESA